MRNGVDLGEHSSSGSGAMDGFFERNVGGRTWSFSVQMTSTAAAWSRTLGAGG